MPDKIYYSMPFRAEKLIRRVVGEPPPKLEKCELIHSVKQNVRLLLLTPPTRVRFAPMYGCKVHWLQFLASNRAMEPRSKAEAQFKTQLQDNIKLLIERFEPRLILQSVQVLLDYATDKDTLWKSTRRSQLNVIKLSVRIIGVIKDPLAEDEILNWDDDIALL